MHGSTYIHVVLPSCAFMPSICKLMTYQSCITASFSVPLLSIFRGKLHRQVHVCDLLISYNHSPSTFTAVHPCCIPWPTFRRSWKEILQERLHLVYVACRAAAYIGSGNETAMEVSASDLG